MEFLPYALSGVAALVLGAVFYHPKTFGTMWMNAAGLSEEDLKGGNMAVIFGLAFVMAMMVASMMGYVMGLHPEGHEGTFGPFGHGAFHGLITGALTALPVIVTISLFERRNVKYMFVHVAYWLLVFAVIGGIVTAM